MKTKEIERTKAIEALKGWVKPGDTIFTKMIHVSRSGMYRVIDLYVIKDNEPLRLSWSVGTLIEGYDKRHEGAKANGCGMDMGFHLVNNLGYELYPEGFTCTGEKCPSNDHSNGDRNYEPHHHKSGGYAFNQRWL